MAKTDPILIVGAGTFGLSTALKLARSGYTNVTVLEKDERVPSRFSGAFDLNKVIRCEYIDPFYTDVALKAIHEWQTNPLYQPHFRQVGFLNVVSAAATPVAQNSLAQYRQSVAAHPAFAGSLIPCADAAAVRQVAPQLTGPLPGWHGYLNRLAGYAHSSNAMQAVYRECVRLGVVFCFGRDGEVDRLLYDNSHRCTGARTVSGHVHAAATTIVSVGGFVARVVPRIHGQVTAVCWGVAHVQLTPAEAEALRGMPVTTVRDIGFFFEPDPATHKLKLCHLGGGYTNVPHEGAASRPHGRLADSAYMPAEDVRQTRRLLQMALPHLAARPLIDRHLCWIADTRSSDFVVDFVPGAGRSLVVLSGDSGHGFKFMPLVGDWAAALLAAGRQAEARWRWRDAEPEAGKAHVAWRASATVDLADAPRGKL